MLGLYIDRVSTVSITQQLIMQIRSMILDGKLKGGEKLPSSRRLSKELNVSRSTVLNTYDQLLAEGYLECRTGSGTFVVELGKDLPPMSEKRPRGKPGSEGSPDRKVIAFDSGMVTDKLPLHSLAKLIYVVPSHQFPIGGILPVNRRIQLLDFARRNSAYIIEDDYDSEFRYRGLPIQSLRYLDPGRVIYAGTFSKIFSPGLRLGYMIVSKDLKTRVRDIMSSMNIRASSLEQLAIARFIDEKRLDRHIYRMKKHYEKKRIHLIRSLNEVFADRVKISGTNAGLHLLVTFPGHNFSREEIQKLFDNGVAVDRAEEYAIRKGSHMDQLVLGYGNLRPEEITRGVEIIRDTLFAI